MKRKDDESIKSMKEPRQSNIELLRILTIMGVIILHYNNADMGGAFKVVIPDTVNQYVLLSLESIFVCAVNLFVLITGYFMSVSSKRNLIKPIQLIIQVILFSAGIYLVRVLIGSESFSVRSLVGKLIPDNYFVILYIALYFVSPYINLVLKKLSDIKKKQFLILLIVLFSVWPFLVDLLKAISKREWIGLSTIGAYGSQWGYTIINFILLYCIGAYIRTCLFSNNQGSTKNRMVYSVPVLLGIFIGLVTLIMLLSRYDENIAWEYCSPLVVAEAAIVFLLFSKLKIRTNKIINRLATAVFTVFLLHTSALPHINIEYFVQQNIVVMLGHIALTTVSIYFMCWIVHEIYGVVTVPIFKRLAMKMKFSLELDNL